MTAGQVEWRAPSKKSEEANNIRVRFDRDTGLAVKEMRAKGTSK